MANTVNVQDILNYVAENTDILATKTATSADSTKYFNVQTGVVAPTNMHKLTTNLTVQDGKNCGFNPSEMQTISHRQLVPGILKVDAEYCAADFLDTCYNYQTSVAMGRGELPVEEALVNDIIASIKNENERLLWSGDKNSGDLVDGITTLVKADTIVTGRAISKQATAYDTVMKMFKDINMTNYTIYTGMANYRELIENLLEKNFLVAGYQDDNAEHVVMMPAINVKVVGIEGITDANFYAVKDGELFMGVDAQGDQEKFDLWFSQDARTYRLQIKWALAANYMFSENVYIAQ